MSDRRDTQFAGFADLLFDDLSQMGLIAIADPRNFPDQLDLMVKLQAEMNALTQQIIARRAYDLVCHAVSQVTGQMGDEMEAGTMKPQDCVEYVPDFIQWPEVR